MESSVQVTNKNLISTSVKGKGELTLAIEEDIKQQLISLDSIAQNVNDNMKTNAESHNRAKPLKLSCKSNIKLLNDNDAIIETVAIQQNAEITLKNIEIEPKLIIRFQKMNKY